MNVTDVLSRWLASSHGALVQLVDSAGFSGARVWQVTHDQQRYALRQWPPAFPAPRLSEIHELQQFLAASGQPIPAPLPARRGGTLIEAAGALWEFADWRPGVADYHNDPRPEKRRAALHALAHLHRTAAEFISTAGQGGTQIAPAPSLARRQARAEALQRAELIKLRRAVVQAATAGADGDLERLASEALALIGQSLPDVAQRLAAWRLTPLPLQWRLGDVHHDHVLFIADRVTGVIDFGAAAVDAPAGDVARLLGSIAGDDCAAWRDGLTAYEQVRPLTQAERDAVALFDASGTVLAAANWLHWLLVEAPNPAVSQNRPAAAGRLRTLVERLRRAAAH